MVSDSCTPSSFSSVSICGTERKFQTAWLSQLNVLHLIVCNIVSSYSGGLGTPVSHDHTWVEILTHSAVTCSHKSALRGRYVVYLVLFCFFDKYRVFYWDLTLNLSLNSN